ncbi:MAG: hypothetical protein R3F30_03415 [Planctomycetota bacterium]
MSSEAHPRNPWRPPFGLLLLLPILLGLCFQASGSGNGDSPAYRSQVCLLEALGHLDLPRLEWSHPGHVFTTWLIHRPLAALGLWQDPHFTIQLLAFVLLGVAAWAVARTFAAETGRPWYGLLAGLTLALLPGWTWHAQESLSDVAGHCVIVLTVCALLLLRRRLAAGRPAQLAAATSGFLAATAFLFRPGAGLFLPLFGWLTLEALVTGRKRWPRLLGTILLAGLVPLALTYGHLLIVHGVEGLRTRHFIPSGDNIGTTERYERAFALLRTWLHHCVHGLGLFAALVGVTGWLSWSVAGLPDARPSWWGRLRPLGLLLVTVVPYFLFMVSNRTADQFRFTLPVQAALALGIPVLAMQVGRLGGRTLPLALSAVLLLTFAQGLSRWLPLFAGRDAFVERAGQELIAEAGDGDVLLGNQVHPYVEFRSRFRELLAGGWGRPVGIVPRQVTLPVRHLPWEQASDYWNQGWRSIELRMLQAVAEGHRLLLSNEYGLSAFRRWLPLRGFEEQVVRTVPSEELRNRLDNDLGTMDPALAVDREDLVVIELRPPAVRLEAGDGVLRVACDPRDCGMEVRVHGGIYDEGAPVEIGGCVLPFRATSEHGSRALASGFVDEKGRCTLALSDPPETVVALLFRTPGSDEAVGRSQVLCLVPGHDRSDPDLARYRRAFGW